MNLFFPNKKLVFVLFLSISLYACSSKQDKNRQKMANNHAELVQLETSYDQQAALYEHILLARIAVERQLYEQALDYFMSALLIRPDIEIAREALILSEQLNKDQTSIQLAKQWVALDPDALLPWQLITLYSLSSQPLAETRLGIEKILSLEDDLDDSLAFLELFSRGANQSTALELLQSMEGSYAEHPAIQLTIASIYKQRGEWLKAKQLTSRILDSNADLYFAWTLYADILVENDETEAAIQWYRKTLVTFPDARETRNKLGQLLYKLDHYQAAREQFEILLQLDPMDSQARYMVAACYYAEKNFSRSREYFEPLLRVRRHRNPVLFYLGEMARDEKSTETAISLYRQVTPGRYYKIAHVLVARLLQEKGEYQQALDHLKNLQTDDPSTLVDFKLTSLRIMVKQGEQEQAADYLSAVLEQHPDVLDVQLYHIQWIIQLKDPREIPGLLPEKLTHFKQYSEQKALLLNIASLLDQAGHTVLAVDVINKQLDAKEDNEMRYMRAMLAANLGDIITTESDLRLILQSDPEHNDALNALGYTLADANKNLDEARQLIERAYEKNPDSSAIADSMGWVLFRQGELSEALKYLQKAYDLEPLDEIAAHLGELLWSLDKKTQAKQVLDSAIKESPDSKAVKKVIEKLNIQFGKSTEDK